MEGLCRSNYARILLCQAKLLGELNTSSNDPVIVFAPPHPLRSYLTKSSAHHLDRVFVVRGL